MNEGEISAFAAHAMKKKKKKQEKFKMGLDSKSKPKLKKKKKLQNGNINSVVKIINRQNDSNVLQDLLQDGKSKEQESKAVMTQSQSKNTFVGFNGNISFNDSCFKENSFNNLAAVENEQKNGVQKKKLKKKKSQLVNGEPLKRYAFEKFTDENESCKLHQAMVKNKKLLSIKNEKLQASVIHADSMKVGEEVLSWLLSPTELNKFFKDCWEQKPLHIKRNSPSFYKQICTLEDFKTAIREKDLYFTKNIDVTSYTNGERHTENPDGKATISMVWDLFNKGKSIRLLNPQSFIPNIRLLNTTLQEFFHCFVGANIYLTPAGTQGFAPHYDDIEAFVLQLEGEKHWKLYNPCSPHEVLPRVSSRNYREEEIGEPILEVTLKPGDLLYFPRGVIHQAKCLPHVQSLHVTVSCYQRNSWADLFEKVLPVALQAAIAEDVELRKGLPVGFLSNFGMVFSDQETRFRESVCDKFLELGRRILDFVPIDAAADQMAADFIRDSLPPCLAEEEKAHGANRNVSSDQSFLEALKSHTNKHLSVKLVRANVARLVSEEEDLYLYYGTDNALVYHEVDATCARIPLAWLPALEHLIKSYPRFVEVRGLPLSTDEEKPGKRRRAAAELVHFLWQRGLVLFDRTYQAILEAANSGPSQ